MPAKKLNDLWPGIESNVAVLHGIVNDTILSKLELAKDSSPETIEKKARVNLVNAFSRAIYGENMLKIDKKNLRTEIALATDKYTHFLSSVRIGDKDLIDIFGEEKLLNKDTGVEAILKIIPDEIAYVNDDCKGIYVFDINGVMILPEITVNMKNLFTCKYDKYDDIPKPKKSEFITNHAKYVEDTKLYEEYQQALQDTETVAIAIDKSMKRISNAASTAGKRDEVKAENFRLHFLKAQRQTSEINEYTTLVGIAREVENLQKIIEDKKTDRRTYNRSLEQTDIMKIRMRVLEKIIAERNCHLELVRLTSEYATYAEYLVFDNLPEDVRRRLTLIRSISQIVIDTLKDIHKGDEIASFDYYGNLLKIGDVNLSGDDMKDALDRMEELYSDYFRSDLPQIPLEKLQEIEGYVKERRSILQAVEKGEDIEYFLPLSVARFTRQNKEVSKYTTEVVDMAIKANFMQIAAKEDEEMLLLGNPAMSPEKRAIGYAEAMEHKMCMDQLFMCMTVADQFKILKTLEQKDITAEIQNYTDLHDALAVSYVEIKEEETERKEQFEDFDHDVAPDKDKFDIDFK